MNIGGTILSDYANQQGDEFVVLNMVLVSDGYGGGKYTIIEGLQFKGIAIQNTSIQGEIAAKQGVTGLYTFAYDKNISLPPKTIIRRIKDGKVFRTTELDGNATPSISALDMKVTRLEDYIIPSGEKTE